MLVSKIKRQKYHRKFWSALHHERHAISMNWLRFKHGLPYIWYPLHDIFGRPAFNKWYGKD